MICKKCNNQIEWIKTEKGKNMPVDPAEITIVTQDGKTIKGYIPHWSTCTEPDYFRKRNKNPNDLPPDGIVDWK